MSDAMRDSIINLGFDSMEKQIQYTGQMSEATDNSKCSETNFTVKSSPYSFCFRFCGVNKLLPSSVLAL